MSNLPHLPPLHWSQKCPFCPERINSRKNEKRDCSFHDFCVNLPAVQKSNFLSFKMRDDRMEGQNTRFKGNALLYCKFTSINPLRMSMQFGLREMVPNPPDMTQVHTNLYVDLVPWTRHQLLWKVRSPVLTEVEFIPRFSGAGWAGKDTIIRAYYVPYLSQRQVDIHGFRFLTIPRNPLDSRHYVFTGAMNGCSLLLLEDTTDPHNYLVTHYPNQGGHLHGYPLIRYRAPMTYNVIMDIHYDLYRPSGFCFLHYHGGVWTAIVQSQASNPANRKTLRHGNLDSLVVIKALRYNIGDADVVPTPPPAPPARRESEYREHAVYRRRRAKSFGGVTS